MPSIMATDRINSDCKFTQLFLSWLTNSLSTALTQLKNTYFDLSNTHAYQYLETLHFYPTYCLLRKVVIEGMVCQLPS